MINIESINVSLSVVGTHITIGDIKFDIHNICSLLASSLRMLCCGHGVVLSKRKQFLRPFVDQKFHNLLKPTNPVSTELLGPDLEQKIADSTKIVDAGKRLANGYPHRHDCSNNFTPQTTTLLEAISGITNAQNQTDLAHTARGITKEIMQEAKVKDVIFSGEGHPGLTPITSGVTGINYGMLWWPCE